MGVDEERDDTEERVDTLDEHHNEERDDTEERVDIVDEHHTEEREDTEERVDIVDEHDNVLRTVTRAEMRRDRLRHRGVFIAVITSRNELVIHQRSPLKDIWPSYWDIGAGGVVASGETYEESAERELLEELGIEAALLPLGGSYYEDGEVALFGRGFAARHDGPYEFRDGEVSAIELVTLEKFDTLLWARRWCPDSIALALPLIRAHMNNL